MRNNLKLVCTEDEVALMPVNDGSSSRARLVNGGCNSFVNRRSGKVWRTTEEQKILTQVWRISREKININVLRERTEEDVEVQICTRGVFYPRWDGKIHPCTDKPWNNGRSFN